MHVDHRCHMWCVISKLSNPKAHEKNSQIVLFQSLRIEFLGNFSTKFFLTVLEKKSSIKPYLNAKKCFFTYSLKNEN